MTDTLQKSNIIESIYSHSVNNMSLKELEQQQMQNGKLTLNEVGRNDIKAYLDKHEISMLKQGLEPMITTKELITELFLYIGGNPEDKQHQGEVAKFIKSIGWNKKRKRTYRGKKDVSVYIKASTSNSKIKVSKKPETIDDERFLTPSKKEQSKDKSKTATPQKKNSTVNSDNAVAVDNSTQNQTSCTSTTENQLATLRFVDFDDKAITLDDEVKLSSDESAILPWEKLCDMAIDCPELEDHYTAKIVNIGKILVDHEMKVFVDVQWANYQRFRCFPGIYDEQNNLVSCQVKELLKVNS